MVGKIAKFLGIDSTKTFRLLDLLTFGGVTAFSAFFSLYADLAGNPTLVENLGLWGTTAAFLFVYAWFLYFRYKFIKTITYVTPDNLACITNGFDIKEADVQSITEQTISDWEKATGWTDVRTAITSDTLWVEFDKGTVQCMEGISVPLAGYTIANSRSIVVGFAEKPVDQSALAHELGHVIYTFHTGSTDVNEEHSYIKTKGLK